MTTAVTTTNKRHANNGSPPTLPDDRQAAVEYGLAQYQAMAAERDSLQRDVHLLNSELAASRVSLEAYEARVNDADSRVASAMLVRDQAVADRAKYETLFVSVQAQLRAFNIPAAPLVRGIDETDNAPSDGGT